MATGPSRRRFLAGGALAATGLLASTTVQADAEPQHVHRDEHADGAVSDYPRTHPGRGGAIGSPTDRGKLVPGRRSVDQPPVPVEIPDGSKLPWKMVNGVKEYHLVAQHVRQEFLPNQYFDLWGFNGSSPGPAIEAVQGDRVRIVVHNDLPEPTTVHWHGLELPVAMDGVPGLTQDPIQSGKEFAYEFDLHQDGTFFYHSHGAMQEIMGMAGLFIIHPKRTHAPPVDHDFGLVVHEFAILPQNTIPNSMSMEFNFFTINGRSGPYTTPMVVQLGDRVRVRWMNLSPMDHHPMHFHGHTFWTTGTEGGRLPEALWMPGNTVLVGVGQSRDVEFVANNPGDWAFHCHILHHMMNHMTSMVGPMGREMGNQGGRQAGADMGPSMGMVERGLEDLGPALGRGTGEMTGSEREVRTGSYPGLRQKEPGYRVPGYPQDMMGMMHHFSAEEQRKLTKPQTQGMRRNWFMGLEAMMTAVRVLPPDLYEQVMAGKGEIPAGASIPGASPGKMPGGHQH